MGVSLFTAAVPEIAGAAFVIYLLLGLLGLVLSLMFLSAFLRWAAIWGLLAGFAGFTVLGLIQAAGVKLSFMLPIQWWRPASTFANRNIAAQFIVFGLPFLLFAAGKSWQLGKVSGKKRWYGLLAGLLAVAAGALVLLFINASKNGLLALAVQVLYLPLAWFWLRNPSRQNSERHRRLLKLIAGALAGVVLVLSIALTVPQTRGRMLYSWRLFKQKGVTGVLRARYLFWRNTLVMIRDHPLTGVGIGNFRIVYPLYSRSFAWDTVTGYTKRARKAHNDYLQLAAECGIPALVLFLILLVRQFYLLRIPEAGEGGEDEGRIADDWRWPLGASLLAYAVVMCFSFPLQLAYSRMFFFFLIALGEARAWRASLK
jgi:O-antigen ligase